MTRVEPEIDRIVDRYYYETVGPYWPERARLVEDGYASMPFPFKEFSPPEFTIQLDWNLDDILGYLRSWSPTRRFIERNGYDPVDLVAGPLADAWGNGDKERTITWPLHVRIGRV